MYSWITDCLHLVFKKCITHDYIMYSPLDSFTVLFHNLFFSKRLILLMTFIFSGALQMNFCNAFFICVMSLSLL